MKASSMLRQLLFVTGLALAAGAYAQTPGFKPEVGQAGKDVVWVPTSDVLVNKMLDMAKATPADYLMDLGSGDGRTVIAAAKRGITAQGIEYNPDMVKLSQENATKAGVSDKATFMKADIFQTDFSKATVITLFLLPDLNLRLRPILLNMKPGTRVVSNSFTMGDWEDDDTATAGEGGDCSYWCIAHMWIVPAKVEGTWQFTGGKLMLKQKYQMISGSVEAGGQPAVVGGKMRGDQIAFKAGNAEYSGRVSGNTIEGTVKTASQSNKWVATRAR
jgi:hypothetical protein